MNMRPATLGAVVIIVVVGFAIGAWLAIRTRGTDVQTQRVTVASNTTVAAPVRTLAPRPVQTLAPRTIRTLAPAPTPTAFATATSIPTPAPTATPVAKPSTLSTPAPSVATTAPVAHPALQGSWQLDEANVQVGAILWVGEAAPARGNAIVFNLRKQSVGGRRAMPCERQTSLHAAFSFGVAQQTVPYREVNCDGVVSTGEVRVTSFSGDGASFSGSFSQNGVNLGTFTARKL